MADSIKIQLSDMYEPITEEMISKAKKWTLQRNENAAHLSSLIEELLHDAVKTITQIAYKYNCKPEEWHLSQDKNLREEVAQVMSDLEDDIMALVEEYALNETQDKKRRSNLLPWLMALKSKGSNDLRSTLHERLRQFLYDTEAQIAAMKLAGYNMTKAITRSISTMHSVYSAPEVQAAYKKQSAAMYIESKGIHYGNVGLSSSGANNVESFGYQTATLGWEKTRLEEEKEEGKAGYIVRRGSNFDCVICDEVCAVFHPIEEGMVLPVHSHCCCYAVFVNLNEELSSSKDEQRKQEYLKYKNDENYKDVQYSPENGGLKATHRSHKEHQNDNKRYFPEQLTGDELEKEFQNLAYKLGHSVIFRAEANNRTDLDMILDGTKMDLVSVTNNSKAFNNQLGRKNEQLIKYNGLYNENNNSVCMFFHNPSYYSYEKVKNGLEKLIEYGANVRIQNVYVLLNDGSDIFKLEFP